MPTSTRHSLPAAAARSVALARRLGEPFWLVWRRACALGAPAPRFERDGDDRFRFEAPARGFVLAATGAAARLDAAGDDRFDALAEACGGLAARAVAFDEGDLQLGPPILVGGFAFAAEAARGAAWRSFPAARLVLPERLLARDGARAWEQRATRVDPGDAAEIVCARLRAEPPARAPAAPAPAVLRCEGDDAAHRARVTRAVQAVLAGELEKLVVARELVCRGDGRFEPEPVLALLRERHPECFVFGVGFGDESFVGASPERLARVAGGVVEADALAGTAPRGRDAGEDAHLAAALRERKKDQAEHAVVVRALREALAPLCGELAIDEAPRVRRLAHLQHLHTRARGRLLPGLAQPLLSLAARLHPTPAVAGAPRAAALAWLRRNEDLERGWYAGGVGWVDLAGEGELAVALRSAWLRGGEARVFAGSGIVAGSDPEAELRETRLKLEPALRALARETT
jgi:isochorismate synthase